MSDPVQITRTIFGKNTFQNVINTKFNELAVSDPSVTVQPIVGVKEFFQTYDELFFDIPSSGSFSGSLGLSHLDLVNRSSDYIGVSFSDLEAEIKALRSENVALKNQIFVLSQQPG